MTEDYQEKFSVRISNFIRIINEHRICFNPPRGYKKSIKKQNWFVLGKVIKRCHNCKAKILENDGEFEILRKDSVWNFENKASKRSRKQKK